VFVRLLTAALATLALAPVTSVEARNVPRGFYGVSYDGDLRSASPDKQSQAWRRMAANGVESARSVFSWQVAQSARDEPFDFASFDQLVENAATRGVGLLPIVGDTPWWARNSGEWWPRDTADLASYMKALVARYGPDGTFWTEHPDLPRQPLRHWQIYNEPGLSRHYGPLLKAAHRAVEQSDPGAKIVLAGLTGLAGRAPWDVLRWQYRHGDIKRWFDIAALHLYTGEAENLDDGLRLFRRVMKRHEDGDKPVWMTEFGITASKGRTTAPRHQRTLRTTDTGMASFLEKAYRLLARKDRRLNLQRAYWYTWASSYEEGASIFRFAGLNRYADGRLEAMPALASYRASARRDQG
jgi:hypothetical protein